MNALGMLAALRLEDGETCWGDAATEVQLRDARRILSGSPPLGFMTRARGYSKTTDCAACAATMLTALPAGSRCYWLAADAEQGALALDAIAGFVARTPLLKGVLDVQSRRVVATKTGASLDVLPADQGSAWGLKPSAVFVDEIAQWGDTTNARRLWEAVSSAVLKVKGARLAVMTTAGSPSHWSYPLLEHARSSALWWTSETGGPPPWAPRDMLEEQRARLPEAIYAQLWRNEWVEAGGAFFTAEAVARCFTLTGPALRPVEGRRYFAGLDLGHVNDASVFAMCHREGLDVHLDALVRWQGSRKQPVSFREVEETIAGIHRRFRFDLWADQWQAKPVIERLQAKRIRAREFAFSTASKQRLASTLLQSVNDGTLQLFEPGGLRDELVALRVKQQTNGTWTFDHSSGRHDDMAVAVALALTQALSEPSGEVSQSCAFCGQRLAERTGWKCRCYEDTVVQRGDLALVGRHHVDRPSVDFTQYETTRRYV